MIEQTVQAKGKTQHIDAERYSTEPPHAARKVRSGLNTKTDNVAKELAKHDQQV